MTRQAHRWRPMGLGPRDLLLATLSVSAGVADSISISTLDAFTGAITGDVVLLGVSLGGGDPHRALRAAIALCGFALGVFGAVRAASALAGADGRPSRTAPSMLLAAAALLQCGFLVLWLSVDGRPDPLARDGLVAMSALAMGAQTGASRRLHPTAGLATTYITGTFTVLLGELATGSGERTDRARRIVLVVAIAAGAALGALILAHARNAVAVIPPLLSASVALAALRAPQEVESGSR